MDLAPSRRTAAAALFVLVGAPCSAQVGDMGARAIGLAGAGVAFSNDVWSDANPASSATTRARAAGLFASQAFGLPELRTIAAGAVVPTRLAAATIAVRSFGFSDYRELRASLGGARTVPVAAGRRLALGIRADYHAITIAGFGTRSAIDIAVGLQADFSPSVSGGASLRNALSIARSDSVDIRVPHTLSPVLAIGMALRPSATTTLAIDVEKDLDFTPTIRTGVEFRPVQSATLRLGSAVPMAGGDARVAFGAGFEVAALLFDAAVDWHMALGPSPAVGITARF